MRKPSQIMSRTCSTNQNVDDQSTRITYVYAAAAAA
jgi:hypothetical protein